MDLLGWRGDEHRKYSARPMLVSVYPRTEASAGPSAASAGIKSIWLQTFLARIAYKKPRPPCGPYPMNRVEIQRWQNRCGEAVLPILPGRKRSNTKWQDHTELAARQLLLKHP
jgi:hypothetical protein